jgi:hypothetical protein
VLGVDAALRELAPTSFTSVVARGGGPIFQRIESVTADAADSTVRARLGDGVPLERVISDDPRDRTLEEKYARTRNPEFLARESRRRVALLRGACAAVNLTAAAGRRRRLSAVAVHQYAPTAAFARAWARRRARAFALARLRFGLEDLGPMLRAGDRALMAAGGRPAGAAGAATSGLDELLRERAPELREGFAVRGVDLLDLLEPRLRELVAEYATWIDARAPALRRDLRRARVGAVLVPFDGPPEARLLVRVAQREGIPTVVINDGWKGDDHSAEGMTADYALAWSPEIAKRYFSRRSQSGAAIVTGDPRADEGGWPAKTVRHGEAIERLLIGSFTFSPVDLNCGRSDPERFMAEVLEGIRRSHRARDAAIVVKLHPADRPGTYAGVLPRFADLQIEVVTEGDVVALFREADAYVTTYSTSLLEAAAAGVPFAYYRVNDQRLHPPFSDDPLMAERTAGAPGELARLLDDPDFCDLGEEARARAWVERHLGPRDGGNAARVAAALEDALSLGPR